jgi:hypothetical protein
MVMKSSISESGEDSWADETHHIFVLGLELVASGGSILGDYPPLPIATMPPVSLVGLSWAFEPSDR